MDGLRLSAMLSNHADASNKTNMRNRKIKYRIVISRSKKSNMEGDSKKARKPKAPRSFFVSFVVIFHVFDIFLWNGHAGSVEEVHDTVDICESEV